MKFTERLLLSWFLLLLLACTSDAQTVRERLNERGFKLYSVIFGVTIDTDGSLAGIRVSGIAMSEPGRKTPVKVEIPQPYLDAARQLVRNRHYEPKLEDGKPVEFFVYFFYTPIRPSVVITDLDQPLPNENHVAANAPQDQPKQIAREKAEAYERAIAPHIAKARRTYESAKKRFLAGLPAKHTFFITTRIRDKDGTWEQVFIAVDEVRDGKITGRISSDLQSVKEFKEGDHYTFPEAELMDWLITRPDGTEEGNFVGKFLDTYKP